MIPISSILNRPNKCFWYGSVLIDLLICPSQSIGEADLHGYWNVTQTPHEDTTATVLIRRLEKISYVTRALTAWK